MYRILLRGFTAVSLSEPCILGISFAAAAEEDGVDLSMDLLNGENFAMNRNEFERPETKPSDSPSLSSQPLFQTSRPLNSLS